MPTKTCDAKTGSYEDLFEEGEKVKPPAFQFYADDFVAGVADMTQSEVGSYILLLCHQWNRGEIPTDPARAALIAKGEVSEHVMSKFPGGKNARMETVRQQREQWIEKSRIGGIASAALRKGASTTLELPFQPKGNTPTPTPTPTPKEEDMCLKVYEEYPKKVDRKSALKAIKTALKNASLEFLIERTKAFAKAVDGTDMQFVPYPATWFNKERYNEDPETWKKIYGNSGKNHQQHPQRINRAIGTANEGVAERYRTLDLEQLAKARASKGR